MSLSNKILFLAVILVWISIAFKGIIYRSNNLCLNNLYGIKKRGYIF